MMRLSLIALAAGAAAVEDNFEQQNVISLLQGRVNSLSAYDGNLSASDEPQCNSWMKAEDYVCDQHHRAECKEKGDKKNRGCNRNQVRCDKNLYQNSDLGLPCCEKQNLFSLLLSIDQAFCGKVEYGLFYGSLAGSMKLQDLPDHDAEAELVIRQSDADKAAALLREAAAKDGFVSTQRRGRFVINWGPKNLLHVDIWFLWQEAECAVVQRSDLFVMKFPADLLQKLGDGRCAVQDQGLPCPEASEQILDGSMPSWRSDHSDPHEEPHCDAKSSCCGLEKRLPDDELAAGR